MLHITICDDEPVQQTLLSGYVAEWQKMTGTEAEVEKFDSADRFFFAWEEKKETDILLLDIEMPGMDGMMLAHKLRESGESVQIIFVTGKPDYVFLGYEVDAVSYLMKPVRKEQLFSCLERAKERSGRKEAELLIETAGEVQKIKVRDVCYLESQAHDTLFYLAGNVRRGHLGEKTGQMPEEVLCSKKGIHVWEKEVAEKSSYFYKPHRSYFVNLAHVDKIAKKEIQMDNGTVIPIARGKWEEINLAYMKFCRRAAE